MISFSQISVVRLNITKRHGGGKFKKKCNWSTVYNILLHKRNPNAFLHLRVIEQNHEASSCFKDWVISKDSLSDILFCFYLFILKCLFYTYWQVKLWHLLISYLCLSPSLDLELHHCTTKYWLLRYWSDSVL